MTKPHLTRAHLLDLLREMLRIRRFEEKCAELYQAEKIRGFLHLYIGEEAVAVGVMKPLRPEDAIVATYREHGHALVRGVSMNTVMAEMYGKREGCSGGRGGSPTTGSRIRSSRGAVSFAAASSMRSRAPA